MNESVIPYIGDIPEIPDREAHIRPEQHLKKSSVLPNSYEIVNARRPSNQLLVSKLRESVDKWRQGSYIGASDVTKRLFNYWFEEDHFIDDAVFRYYYGQREAIETLVYLHEIEKIKDFKDLQKFFSNPHQSSDLFLQEDGIEFLTSTSGKRQIRRYFPDDQKVGIQDIPPENLQRLAFKLATGSGKTVIMAMAIVWSYFHKQNIPDSEMSSNFLILAPNVIVYERLKRDFANNAIFRNLPLVPAELQFDLKVILRDDHSSPTSKGNLFLTHIHQLYGTDEQDEQENNPIQSLIGSEPQPSFGTRRTNLLQRIFSCDDLVVINDEAHHVHQEEQLWTQILTEIHQAIPNGLSLWLDFSATPKDQNGTYFSWIICDYPLAQAIEDHIVKQPLIVHMNDDADPERVTTQNVVSVYENWLTAAMTRLREHQSYYQNFASKPVLFIMAEKSPHADAIGKWLIETPNMNLSDDEVLVIHTDSTGEVTKKDLDRARQIANTIDEPDNRVKVVVSVLMLREGWDVRNVTVALGLRPFTSNARILPEQAIGRGLRLIKAPQLGNVQTLEVMGTKAFEDFVRELEVEGVGIETTTVAPLPPVIIEPVQERFEFDIGIPITQPLLSHEYKNLENLDPMELPPICNAGVLDEMYSQKLVMEFLTTETIIHEEDLNINDLPIAQVMISSICSKIERIQGLTNVFNILYPIVNSYIKHRCFGLVIDINDKKVRSHLHRPELQNGVASYLARKISALTVTKRSVQFENQDFRLSDVKRFAWRRKVLVCNKTIFNYVAAYNNFESNFAQYLDRCQDILKFSALATTGQGANGQFRVNYLNQNGAIRFYYPDWLAVQAINDEESVNWIVETKGRIWEDTIYKDRAMRHWCEQISANLEENWKYIRINQSEFEGDLAHTASFAKLLNRVNQKG